MSLFYNGEASKYLSQFCAKELPLPSTTNILQHFGMKIEITNQDLLHSFMVYLVLPIFLFNLMTVWMVPFLLRVFPNKRQQTLLLSKDKKVFELNQRLIRGFLASSIAIHSAYYTFFSKSDPIPGANYILVSSSFFHLSDTIILYLYRSSDKTMVVHHLIVIILSWVLMIVRKSLSVAIVASTNDILVPISTILSWLYSYNLQNTFFNLFCSVLSVLILVFYRMPSNTYLAYTIIGKSDYSIYPVALLLAGIVFLEIKWARSLIKICMKNFNVLLYSKKVK
ncbi:hypothetical protein PPL_12590 [Heterostelium album PN500]|uniref:TLC domain-containing protein n=1 Tax=Heterostelium pallidum (strain ATCC 26659 / Pp 5 / PN500) TaxID=670386 RepID=D3BN15_HETP5|nr:hypothetical protein PPL_12590 [Heterostelium album PN500]EFA77377.1 hypothetical protein PPL_12590 [Heterostelium album PN500]|eukprot:XP_020429506.1 hypothetical protein PPL_12590 [Heterostelium album PN500]